MHWAIETLIRSGDVVHLIHVIPEPKMVHIWAGKTQKLLLITATSFKTEKPSLLSCLIKNTGVYIPPDEDAELMEIEDTKAFVKNRFVKSLIAAKIPFQLHVIVGPVDSENVSRVIAKKVKDLNADVVVIAKHKKSKLKEYWDGSVTKSLIKYVENCPIAVVPHT